MRNKPAIIPPIPQSNKGRWPTRSTMRTPTTVIINRLTIPTLALTRIERAAEPSPAICGLAMGVASLTNWSFNLLVTVSFFTLVHGLELPWTFWAYGLVSVGA